MFEYSQLVYADFFFPHMDLFMNWGSTDATTNTPFLRRGRAFPRKPTKTTKTVDKQASGPHTLGREIISPIQMTDFELNFGICLTNYDVPCKCHLKLWSTFMKLEPFLFFLSGILRTSVYVYGSQNEFVERVTRAFILRMRSLGKNGPLRRNTVFAVARIKQRGTKK